MTRQEIIDKVNMLSLPQGSYVVFGSGPMAAVGIREAGDVDLYVTEGVLRGFVKQGWKQIIKGPKDAPYASGGYEAHANWDFSPYNPTLSQLLKTVVVLDGVSFASLEEVRKWKIASGGSKHLADVELIDNYLAKRKDRTTNG